MVESLLKVILVFGQPLCLKSTLSSVLSGRLEIGLVSTAFFGKVDYDTGVGRFEESRDIRYGAAAEIGRCYVKAGWSVVLDGNYTFAKWRMPIYELCEETGANLFMIECQCADKEILLQRELTRRRVGYEPDSKAMPYSRSRMYSELSPQFDSSEDRHLVNANYFGLDSCRLELKVVREVSDEVQLIYDVLNAWMVKEKQSKIDAT